MVFVAEEGALDAEIGRLQQQLVVLSEGLGAQNEQLPIRIDEVQRLRNTLETLQKEEEILDDELAEILDSQMLES